MLAADVTSLTLSKAAALIKAREISPLELTSAYLERIELLNPVLNAYITVTSERALEDARQATEEIERGRYHGSLHGIPIALKDVFDTAGIRTTAGSTVYRDRVPALDSSVARKLGEAGAILLGKTNLDELAFGGPDNPHFPPSRNPWNVEHVPGGSSGGSAGAVAADLAAGAFGTDTAGSIRLPASFCGVVGLKPTYGRVSKTGVMALSPSFDHVGPMARTVEDTALLLGAVAGYDPLDATTSPMPVPDYAANLTRDLRALRVAVLRPYFFDLLEDEERASIESALTVLRDLGAEVIDDECSMSIEAVHGLGPWIMSEAANYHAEALARRPDEFGEDVYRNLTQEPATSLALIRGMRAIQALSEEMRCRLESVDVFVTPSTPVVAPLRGQTTIEIAGEHIDFRSAFVRCLTVFSATHLPALTVPCGFGGGGLPIGLQIIGKPFDEQTVLNVGYAYERATNWWLERPNLV